MEYLLDLIHRNCLQWRLLYDLFHCIWWRCSIFLPTTVFQWLVKHHDNKAVLDHRSWFRNAANHFQENSRRDKNYFVHAFRSCDRFYPLFGVLIGIYRYINVQSWHQAIQLLCFSLESWLDCSILNLPLRVQLFIYWIPSLSRSWARQEQGENAQSYWDGDDYDHDYLFIVWRIRSLFIRLKHIVRYHVEH